MCTHPAGSSHCFFFTRIEKSLQGAFREAQHVHHVTCLLGKEILLVLKQHKKRDSISKSSFTYISLVFPSKPLEPYFFYKSSHCHLANEPLALELSNTSQAETLKTNP